MKILREKASVIPDLIRNPVSSWIPACAGLMFEKNEGKSQLSEV